MSELDPTLRALKAAVAFELRAEAADLDAQAATLRGRAAEIERTWKLRHQTYDYPDTRPLPTRAAELTGQHPDEITNAEWMRRHGLDHDV